MVSNSMTDPHSPLVSLFLSLFLYTSTSTSLSVGYPSRQDGGGYGRRDDGPRNDNGNYRRDDRRDERRDDGGRDDRRYERRDDGERQERPRDLHEHRGFQVDRNVKPAKNVFPTEAPFKAYVGNMPYDVPDIDQDIRKLFEGLEIVGIQVPRNPDSRHKGFGYVEFKTIEELQIAVTLNGAVLHDRTVRVDLVDGPNERGEFFFFLFFPFCYRPFQHHPIPCSQRL